MRLRVRFAKRWRQRKKDASAQSCSTSAGMGTSTCSLTSTTTRASCRTTIIPRRRLLWRWRGCRRCGESQGDSADVAEGVFERWALRSQEFRPVFGDDHVVFEANAELALDVDAGLVAEGHAGLEVGSGVEAEHVVAHQVGPFVAVHADAVADAMREASEAGAVAAVDNDLARRGVDVGGEDAGTCSVKSGRLRALDEIEDCVHLRGGLAEDECAGDVGVVALDEAAVVEHEDRAVAQRLRLAGA